MDYPFRNDRCIYKLGKLQNNILLFDIDSTQLQTYDKGYNDYITSSSESPLNIKCQSVVMNVVSSFDERYQFEKTITCVVRYFDGIDDFLKQLRENKYYVISKNFENRYFILNENKEYKMTYEFVINQNESYVEITFSSLSNYNYNVVNINYSYNSTEIGSNSCNYIFYKPLLSIIERNAARYVDGTLYYMTDMIANMDYLNDSISFTSTYDGQSISNVITFSEPFNAYCTYPIYELLKEPSNPFIAMIDIGSSRIYVGNDGGLFTNISIQTSEEQSSLDIVTVTMSELTSYDLIFGSTDDNKTYSSKYFYTYAKHLKDNKGNDVLGYRCVDYGMAEALVIEQISFGGEHKRYYVREGYESEFSFLGNFGTFNVSSDFGIPLQFESYDCKADCVIGTSFPMYIKFISSNECKTMIVLDDCLLSYSIRVEDTTNFTLTDNGNGNYTLCYIGTSDSLMSALVLDNDEREIIIPIIVDFNSGFITPTYAEIDSKGGNVIFNFVGITSDSVEILNHSNELVVSVTSDGIVATVSRNNTDNDLYYSIDVMNKDNGEIMTLTIKQHARVKTWVLTDGYICELA